MCSARHRVGSGESGGISGTHRRHAGFPVGAAADTRLPDGFLSLAALRVLDQVVGSGARIVYSGDWDGNGLAIAHTTLKRSPHAVRL